MVVDEVGFSQRTNPYRIVGGPLLKSWPLGEMFKIFINGEYGEAAERRFVKFFIVLLQ